MGPGRESKAEAIFLEALGIPEPQRPDYLQRACSGDKDLLTRVETLLRCYRESDEVLGLESTPERIREVLNAALNDSPTAQGANLVHGQMLSHYKLAEEIGRGGMGVVWRATDTVLSRTVAIKVLPQDLALDERARRMFLAEARTVASLSHANIVQVHELGREGDLEFIVMEYVVGDALSKLLHGKPLAMEKVANLGLQVAQGLVRAHRKNLIHRDLKPANILVTPEGEVKIVDFGLAALFERSESTTSTIASTGTAVSTGARIRNPGTVPYMSPEQVRGEALDARSDIFSFGTVLYELTTGQRPFHGNRKEIVEQIERCQPIPVHQLLPSTPFDLNRIIEKAMSRRPHDRYQSVDDLAVDLKRLVRELEAGTAPSYERVRGAVDRRRKQRQQLLLIAGVVAVLAALSWLVFWRIPTEDTPTILVLPLETRGGVDSFVGQVVGEAIAISLAQAVNLAVLPAPTKSNAPQTTLEDILVEARVAGADFVLRGNLSTDGDAFRASVHLIDPMRNRIRWGTQREVPMDALPTLASLVVQELAFELDIDFRFLYDRPFNMRGGPDMAGSPVFAEAVGAQRRHDLDAELDATRRLVETFPSELAAHVMRTDALLGEWHRNRSSANREACEYAMQASERVDARSPYPDVYRGMWLTRDTRHREAIALFNKVLARGDLTPAARAWILIHRSDAEDDIDEVDAAIKSVEEAMRLAPDFAPNYKFLAGTLRNAGRLEEALVRGRQAAELDPNDWQTWGGLGGLLARMGRMAEAIEATQKSCQVSGFQLPCANVAIQLFKNGESARATAAMQYAASLPESVNGLYNLACYSALSGDSRAALKYLQRALELGFENVHIARDSDFESLRGMSEFDAIVAEVERRAHARTKSK